MTTYPKTPRTTVKRIPDRGHYDQETVHAILDEGMIAHIGYAPEGQPFVIPTLYARIGDEIVFHGAKASRTLKYIQNGGQICINVMLVQGLVLARSVFHHSMNYRSVVVFGTGRIVDDPKEKMAALLAISEQVLPGRWDDARSPSKKEMFATTVVAVKIEEASAKVRAAGVGDEAEDYDLPVWAGILPIHQYYGEPIPDEDRKKDEPVPEYIHKVAGQQV